MIQLSKKSLSLAVLAGLAVAGIMSSADAARRGGSSRGRSFSARRSSGGSSFRRSGSSSFRRSGSSSIRRGSSIRRTTPTRRTSPVRRGGSIGSRIQKGIIGKKAGNNTRRIIGNNKKRIIGNNTKRIIGNNVRRNIGRNIGRNIRNNIIRRGVGNRRIVVSSRIRNSRRIWRRGLFGHRNGRRWGFGIVGRRFYFGFNFVRPIRNYYNPYCGYDTFVPSGGGCDYSQPIVDDGQFDQGAMNEVDNSGDAFLQGDYETALAQADKAVKEMPNNPDVHMYRSLVLFALGRYQESAAAAHAALTGGGGWNWETLKSFYSDVDVYTQQLRALEAEATKNPADSFIRFLLAVHYMMMNHADAAGAELAAVVALEPNDALSAALLKSVQDKTGKTYKSDVQPKAAPAGNAGNQQNGTAGNGGASTLPPLPPTANAGPTAPQNKQPQVAAKGLVGTWKAVRENNLTITLVLSADGKFEWKIDAKGQKVDIKGTYKVNGTSLSMARSQGPGLDGTIEMKGKDAFKFTAKSAPANDPGFEFKRQ